MKNTLKNLIMATTLATLSSSVFSADMMMRMRAINVMPDEGGNTSIKGTIKINNDSVPEVDFTYFFNKNFATELILATTTHKLGLYNSALGNVDMGDVSLLPPTLLAQYHFNGEKMKPYVGAGINYTFFYGGDTGTLKHVKVDNAFGYALQIGTDYKIAENTYVNFDAKKIFLSTDASVETTGGAKATAEVDINPYIIGIGVGFRY